MEAPVGDENENGRPSDWIRKQIDYASDVVDGWPAWKRHGSTLNPPPVANLPAPDVEAIAKRIVSDHVKNSRRSEGAPWLEAAIYHALTAHAASLQARVEELERERDEARDGGRWHEHNWLQERDLKVLAIEHCRMAEAEANRMREALAKAIVALAEAEHALWLECGGATFEESAALVELRAALRPADEPVTQREM
jgi:hypothetical protein